MVSIFVALSLVACLVLTLGRRVPPRPIRVLINMLRTRPESSSRADVEFNHGYPLCFARGRRVPLAPVWCQHGCTGVTWWHILRPMGHGGGNLFAPLSTMVGHRSTNGSLFLVLFPQAAGEFLSRRCWVYHGFSFSRLYDWGAHLWHAVTMVLVRRTRPRPMGQGFHFPAPFWVHCIPFSGDMVSPFSLLYFPMQSNHGSFCCRVL